MSTVFSEQRRELKAAVGAERVAPPPGPGLVDIMKRSGPIDDATDGDDGPVFDLTDIEFGDEVMEGLSISSLRSLRAPR